MLENQTPTTQKRSIGQLLTLEEVASILRLNKVTMWLCCKKLKEGKMSMEKTGVPPSLLIYSRADQEVPLFHGVELAQRLTGSALSIQEKTDHIHLGQVGLHLVVAFFPQESHHIP